MAAYKHINNILLNSMLLVSRLFRFINNVLWTFSQCRWLSGNVLGRKGRIYSWGWSYACMLVLIIYWIWHISWMHVIWLIYSIHTIYYCLVSTNWVPIISVFLCDVAFYWIHLLILLLLHWDSLRLFFIYLVSRRRNLWRFVVVM